ncbi:hypothetical protein DFS34DRAFT_652593 [Phlyctochytrium arcticum]|nr:hypothetical protein DFS34DRAFT_652593 [Phlyctochytrium arcticum]
MDQLDQRVLDLINLDQSKEYQEASRLVKKYEAGLAYIKAEMKKRDIQTITGQEGTHKKTLSFNIGKQHRVDTGALPMDIRELYTKVLEVWTKCIKVEPMVESESEDSYEPEENMRRVRQRICTIEID